MPAEEARNLALKPLALRRAMQSMADASLLTATGNQPRGSANVGALTPQPASRSLKTRLPPSSGTPSPQTRATTADDMYSAMAQALQASVPHAKSLVGSTLSTSAIPSLTNPERAVISLTGASDRCRAATKAMHYAILETSRATVLEARRERSHTELTSILKHIFPDVNVAEASPVKGSRGQRGAPSIMVPTVTTLIDRMVEQRNEMLLRAAAANAGPPEQWTGGAGGAALLMNKDVQEAAKVAFEEHMANQMKWLIAELGVMREGSEVLDERYRLLLVKTAEMEENAYRAEQRRREAETAKVDALRMLTEERDRHGETRESLSRELQHLRHKLFATLEAQAQGLTMAQSRNNTAPPAATDDKPSGEGPASPKGQRGVRAKLPTAASPSSPKLKTGETAGTALPVLGPGKSTAVTPDPTTATTVSTGGVSFEEKEKLLRQLVELRKESTDSKRECSILQDKVLMATGDAEKARGMIATIRRNCDAEVKNYQDLLVSIRDSHHAEVVEMEKNYNQLLHQVQVYEASVFELQAKLQDVSARMLSMQNTLMSGPSVQTLLFKTFVKSQDASMAQEEINRMTSAISQFVERFEEESSEGSVDPEVLYKQAQRRKVREAEKAAAAAAEHAKRAKAAALAEQQSLAEKQLSVPVAAPPSAAISPTDSNVAQLAVEAPRPATVEPAAARRETSCCEQQTQTDATPPALTTAATPPPILCSSCRGTVGRSHDAAPSPQQSSHRGTPLVAVAAVDEDASRLSPTPSLVDPTAVAAAINVARRPSPAIAPVTSPTAQPSIAPPPPTAVPGAPPADLQGDPEIHTSLTNSTSGGGGGGGILRRSVTIQSAPPDDIAPSSLSNADVSSAAAAGGVRSAADAVPAAAPAVASPKKEPIATRRRASTVAAASAPSNNKPPAPLDAVAKSDATQPPAPTAGDSSSPSSPSGSRRRASVSGAASSPQQQQQGTPAPVAVAARPAGISKDQLDALSRASAQDAVAFEESERLRAAKDKAEKRAFDAEEHLRSTTRELAAVRNDATAAAQRITELQEELARTTAGYAADQANFQKMKQRVAVMANDASRLESEATLKEEQHMAEVKALHADIIQLRQENKKLAISDARTKIRNKEKLFYEGVEKIMRCLISLRATASCPVCLDVMTKPVVLVPCGHVCCSACFRNANAAQGLIVVGDSDAMTFSDTTCISAPTTTGPSLAKAAGMVVAAARMSRAARHLNDRIKSAASTGLLSSPEQVEALAYAAAAASKKVKVKAWWCEECGLFSATHIMPSPGIMEVVDKATYVMNTVSEIRRGVVLAASAVDQVEPPPGAVPQLNDSSVQKCKEIVGADLETDAAQFVLDDD